MFIKRMYYFALKHFFTFYFLGDTFFLRPYGVTWYMV